MHRTNILTSFTAAVVCACATPVETLNSERIEQRFGSYGVEVIEQSPVLRRSSLFSIDGAERICRTYAIVSYTDAASISIAAPHQAVLDGGSIGETFRTAGWNIQKDTLYIGELETADLQPSINDLMRIQTSATVGVHVYRLMLSNGNDTIQYATILEAHHPDYLDADELLDIYAYGDQLAPAGESVAALQRLLLRHNE